MDPTLSAAIEAARAAGEVALKYYHGGFDVRLKPDQTPVTQADREAEQVITEILGRAFPDCGFLGEELGQKGPTERRWIVDPIDGTRNFVRRIPFWAVLIALEEQGEVTTGVVLNPVTGELFTARRGEGAFANGERIRVSDCSRLGEALLLHSSLNFLREAAHWDGFVRLVDATERQRGFGDYYGYCLIAEGKAELYVEADLKPWDIAAVKILVEEAGGRLTDFSGRSTIYNGTVLATNGRLHDEALRLLCGR
ncbi:MAG TPA: inositol monophosphatase family protein [Methylomirabilota bacterium]|nr:inositol monophosphatase family protein [Methylomirabilota bacterium]